jgi:type IV secretory pathway VirB2 component (pilin)
MYMKKTFKVNSFESKVREDLYLAKKFTLFVFIYICFFSSAFAYDLTLPIGGGTVFLAFAPTPLTTAISDQYAAGDTPTGGTMCVIVGMMNSGITRVISALAVIALGVGALFGQVKWTQALMLGVGIAMMLGASSLIGQMPDYRAKSTDIATKGIDATFSGDSVQSCN